MILKIHFSEIPTKLSFLGLLDTGLPVTCCWATRGENVRNRVIAKSRLLLSSGWPIWALLDPTLWKVAIMAQLSTQTHDFFLGWTSTPKHRQRMVSIELSFMFHHSPGYLRSHVTPYSVCWQVALHYSRQECSKGVGWAYTNMPKEMVLTKSVSSKNIKRFPNHPSLPL